LDPSCLTDEWESKYDDVLKDRVTALASSTLHRLTGQRVGGCPKTIRPCTKTALYARYPGYYFASGFGSWFPVDVEGRWYNLCGCVGSCGDSHFRIDLATPVGSVNEVKVDGEVLVEDTDYWVDGNTIIRMGSTPWPVTQDLNLPDTDVGTFSITYLNSYPVDGQGAYAAARLAVEYARACTGEKCRLPETVTSIVRQGVSYQLPTGSFPNGETGLREVDAFIALWNPRHRLGEGKVWIPS
jgi:hypothetical protein